MSSARAGSPIRGSNDPDTAESAPDPHDNRRGTEPDDATTLGLLYASTLLAASHAARDGRHLHLQGTLDNLELVLDRIAALPAEDHYSVLDVLHEQLRSAVDPCPGLPNSGAPSADGPRRCAATHLAVQFAAHVNRAIHLTSSEHTDGHDDAVTALRYARNTAQKLIAIAGPAAVAPNVLAELLDTLLAETERDIDAKRVFLRKAAATAHLAPAGHMDRGVRADPRNVRSGPPVTPHTSR